MRALLIDPFLKQVVEYDIDEKLGHAIYKSIEQDSFDIAPLGPNVDCFVGDESLFLPDNRYWSYGPCGGPTERRQMFGGKGLVLTRSDADHVALDPDVTPALLAQHIMWMGDKNEAEMQLQMGLAMRPETSVQGMNKDGTLSKKEVLWQWTPDAEGTRP